ncbi:3-carboxy-cis,cis-muconate cycloisomerase [Streptomyces vilmorinianum]|uniref:3-carboxy-cis,cis-muconate cycloisomerase n=1 Tax=Streptomyces vilmorinianum TaxID=3051092 RepID=UPI0010FAFB9C|nr:3-carboxy-cis,cis-muconate cycloisomerase [Streptomyces vilmorinianum]
MTPHESPRPTDAGLLAPGPAGSPAEAATGDTAFLRALLDAEAALTRAQAAVGQAPAEAAEAVTAAADAARFDVRDLALRARAGGNPVIPLVADLTAAVPGEWRAYVHRGATSQDIMDTAAMLVARRTLDLVLGDLDRTERALAALAAAHRDTAMPGRTLTQHAVPTTFGLKVAGWRSLVLDARDRILAVRDSLPAQLGGAAGTLAAFEAYGNGAGAGSGGAAERLVPAYARETGLAVPLLPWHTLRTPIADLAGALAFTAGALGKTAVDVLTLSRTEIAEVAEGTGGGSSAMPHKANPVRATLVAAAARRAPHLAATLYAAMAAEDERPAGAWHAEWEPLRDLLRLVGGAARDTAELAGGLRVHADVMRAHLDLTGGSIVSERLAAGLSPLVGRARARELLTELAGRARTEGVALAELLGEIPESKGLDLAELTDPTRCTGSAGALTDRALERP